MIIYYMLIMIIFILSFIYTKTVSKKGKNLIFFIIFIVLFLFSALRYNVGADYFKGYVSSYYLIKYGNASHFEILFFLLNKFVIRFFDNVDWLFIISSFVTIYLLLKTLKNESSDFFISSILLFASRFYLYSFGQVRQYIAIAIFLYSIKYIINGDWKKYFSLILLASGFHKTALIYFLVYFVRYLRLNKKVYIMAFLISPLCAPIVNYLYKTIGMNLYSSYIINNIGAGETPIVFIVTGFIFTIIPIIMYKKININKRNQIYLNIQLITWVIITTVSSLNESYRIIGLFIYISFLLLPECYVKMNKTFKTIFAVMLICIAVYSSYLMLIYPDSCLIPYTTIFDKQ